MALSQIFWVKDPQAVKDWQLDWGTNYLAGDVITASTWTIPSGITKVSDTFDNTTVTIWLSGGTEGVNYQLVNHITTAGPRQEDQPILLRVRSEHCYTIAGYDVEYNIRFDIDDMDPEDYEYSSLDLNSLIRKAVDTYGRYRAFVRKGSLTTVADQDLYELPSDCKRLISCEYRTADSGDYGDLDQYYPWLFEDWDRYGLVDIRNHLVSAYDEIGQGFWREVNYPLSYMGGRYVLLYPAPEESGDSVEIWYATDHPLSGTDYDTIPASDMWMIRDLVGAYIDEREARLMMQGLFDYDAGQTRSRSRPRELQTAARSEIRRIERILSSTAVRRGKSAFP